MLFIHNRKKLICILIVIAMLVGTFPAIVLAGESDESECYSAEEGKTFDAEAEITSSWEGHANVDITFINTGSSTIHNWYINVTDVVISAHGSCSYGGCIMLNRDDSERFCVTGQDVDAQVSICVTDLDQKDIENLHLRVCEVGQVDNFPNLPMDILSRMSGIQNVYAWDSSMEVRDNPVDDGNYTLRGEQVAATLYPDYASDLYNHYLYEAAVYVELVTVDCPSHYQQMRFSLNSDPENDYCYIGSEDTNSETVYYFDCYELDFLPMTSKGITYLYEPCDGVFDPILERGI